MQPRVFEIRITEQRVESFCPRIVASQRAAFQALGRFGEKRNVEAKFVGD